MFLTSSQTLDMLSAHAPRAWAKRVLSWQIFTGETTIYFASGSLIERRHVFLFWHELKQEGLPETKESLFAHFDERIAKLVSESEKMESVEVDRRSWSGEPKPFPSSVFLEADEFDWEVGTVNGFFTAKEVADMDDEDIYTESEDSQLDFTLRDMCFDADHIEMLAPNATLPKIDLFSPTARPEDGRAAVRGGPGRRREYDWDAALFYLIGQAEINAIAPDPNAHGAQADIKRILADWFSMNGGRVPADSQLQTMAKRALEAIRSAKS